MTRAPRRRIALCAASALLGMMSLAACADNLNGPNECIFAYDIEPAAFAVNVGDSVAVRATPVAKCGGPQSVTWRIEDAT